MPLERSQAVPVIAREAYRPVLSICTFYDESVLQDIEQGFAFAGILDQLVSRVDPGKNGGFSEKLILYLLLKQLQRVKKRHKL